MLTREPLNEPTFVDFKRLDKEFSDESMSTIREWAQYYGDKFLQSERAIHSLTEKQREELPFILSSFADFCYSYHLQKPGYWTTKAVKESSDASILSLR